MLETADWGSLHVVLGEVFVPIKRRLCCKSKAVLINPCENIIMENKQINSTTSSNVWPADGNDERII